MRTVVWHVPPEYGHYASSREVARQLAAHGYRSVYLSELDMRAHVERDGFGFVPYLPEQYPAGALAVRDQLTAANTYEWWFQRDLAMWRAASSGRLEAELAALAPAAIFADQLNPDTALVAHKMGLPVLRVSSTLPLYYEPDIPPMWSDALPGELSRWELEAEWMCHDAMMQREPWLERDNPIPRRDFYAFVQACGLHIAQINTRSAYNYHVESDLEIVSCARAFDFPKPELEGRRYLGPCLAAIEGPRWTYPGRRDGAPLVYCAFGSKGVSYPAVRRVLAALLDVARRRADLDVVIGSLPPHVFDGVAVPDNVTVLAWAPQREILRVADVFVTHAGLNSTREGLWEGVPLLAIPLSHDQHGVAARIVYHGVGERLLGRLESPAVLGDAIQRLLDEPGYRAAARRMQAACHAEAADPAPMQFVLDAIAGRVVPRAPAFYAGVTARMFRSMMGEDD